MRSEILAKSKRDLEFQSKWTKVKNDRLVLDLEESAKHLREELEVSNALAKSYRDCAKRPMILE
jgi:hypothetical protein